MKVSMKRTILILTAILFTPSALAETHDIYGLWLTESGEGLIEIVDCGDGTPCGSLVWVDPSKDPPVFDIRNRIITLRNRQLIGVHIIWGFKHNPKAWSGGRIYNPEDGKTFRASVKRHDMNSLKAKGCLGPLCITNTWTNHSSNLETTP